MARRERDAPYNVLSPTSISSRGVKDPACDGKAFLALKLCSAQAGGGGLLRTRLLEFSRPKGAESFFRGLYILHVHCVVPRIRPQFLHSPGCRSQNALERRAPIKSWPNGALKLSGCFYPELPHRPFSTAPSLPSSRVRNPTTRLAPEPQDSAAKSKPRRRAPRFVQPFPSTTWPQPQQVQAPRRPLLGCLEFSFLSAGCEDRAHTSLREPGPGSGLGLEVETPRQELSTKSAAESQVAESSVRFPNKEKRLEKTQQRGHMGRRQPDLPSKVCSVSAELRLGVRGTERIERPHSTKPEFGFVGYSCFCSFSLFQFP